MRLLLHIILALMVLGILGGVAMVKVHQRNEEATRSLARAELLRFQQQIHLQMALDDEDGPDVAPEVVDPAWFGDDRPRNPLLPPGHPWLEVASRTQRHRLHPPDLIAADESVAAFWYNPTLGIVRARVPHLVSDSQMLDLYNEVNDSELPSLFGTAP